MCFAAVLIAFWVGSTLLFPTFPFSTRASWTSFWGLNLTVFGKRDWKAKWSTWQAWQCDIMCSDFWESGKPFQFASEKYLKYSVRLSSRVHFTKWMINNSCLFHVCGLINGESWLRWFTKRFSVVSPSLNRISLLRRRSRFMETFFNSNPREPTVKYKRHNPVSLVSNNSPFGL